MAEINAVMIGASRSGKSSILASMYSNMRTKPFTDYFLFETNNSGRDNTSDLRDMINQMRDMVNPYLSNFVPKMSALTGTANPTAYHFLVHSVPLDWNAVNLTIHDVNGEYCDITHPFFDSQILGLVSKAQILIVAVDTPAMMYAKESGQKALNTIMNLPNAVQTAVQKLGSALNNPDAFRMVVFVPIKCEYWLHRNKAADIVAEVKEVYKNALVEIQRYSKIKAMVLPVETIGNCEFDHHSATDNSFILLGGEHFERKYIKEAEDNIQGRPTMRCERIDKQTVRLKNGAYYTLQEDDVLLPVMHRPYHPYCYTNDSTNENTIIPYAWYCATNKGGYAPKNCEQLLLHVLDFATDATIQHNINNMTWWDKFSLRIERALHNIVSFFTDSGPFQDPNQCIKFKNNINTMHEKKIIKSNAVWTLRNTAKLNIH